MHDAPSAPDRDQPTFRGMENALRDACERAMRPGFPLRTMLRLYGLIVGLTRALMQARKDVGLPPGLSDDLIVLLESVGDAVGMHFPDRDMPMEDAMRLQTVIVKLAQVTHRAQTGRLFGPLTVRRRRPPEAAAPPPEPTPEPPAESAAEASERPALQVTSTPRWTQHEHPLLEGRRMTPSAGPAARTRSGAFAA